MIFDEVFVVGRILVECYQGLHTNHNSGIYLESWCANFDEPREVSLLCIFDKTHD